MMTELGPGHIRGGVLRIVHGTGDGSYLQMIVFGRAGTAWFIISVVPSRAICLRRCLVRQRRAGLPNLERRAAH